MKTGKIRTIRSASVAKYAILTMCGFLFFRIGQAAALEQRGYIAYGGECFLLALPLFYYLISTTAREIEVEIKNLNKNGGNGQ